MVQQKIPAPWSFFQNRYKLILCQEDVCLKDLVCCIHLNPLRAELVEDVKALNKYQWCGHSVLKNKTRQEWQNIDYVCKLFSVKKLTGQMYRAFVDKGF